MARRESRKLGYITTGGPARMVYEALADLECRGCGATIPKGSRFTVAGMTGGGHALYRMCRTCEPFTTEDEEEETRPMDREQLEAMAIPVTGDVPQFDYIASLSSSGQINGVTMEEARLLRSYIDFVCESLYSMPFDRLVNCHSGPAAPYAAVSGYNTETFAKCGDGDWRHRQSTWHHGPWMWPQPEAGAGQPMSLAALLDHVTSVAGQPNPKWQAWKRERLP